ncbi:hypothetical protein GQ54DRAFT_311621 [Martensiomyces pterosporus]|nr:hypothetical protein GQ54DRAFT_311621 [Martensiomyces pterosporus]
MAVHLVRRKSARLARSQGFFCPLCRATFTSETDLLTHFGQCQASAAHHFAMAKFAPFGGRGVFHFNSTGDGFACTFCTKKFSAFVQYESHWPTCAGAICKERKPKPLEIPRFTRFPSSFK